MLEGLWLGAFLMPGIYRASKATPDGLELLSDKR